MNGLYHYLPALFVRKKSSTFGGHLQKNAFRLRHGCLHVRGLFPTVEKQVSADLFVSKMTENGAFSRKKF